MNKKRIKTNLAALVCLVVLFCLVMPIRAFADEGKAYDIVNKMDLLMRGKTQVSEAQMTIVNPRWTRTIGMKSWSRGDKLFFIHILTPAREKDITFLKNKNLLYQYLPSAEMRIKITPSMMLQPWMGSDFTNDDLVKESSVVKDYTHRMLGEEKIHGRDAYKIECKAKPDAPVVWGKLILWVDKENTLPMRQEYFDEKGTKIKYMEFTEVVKANDRLIPSRWTMVPLNKKGHKTTYKLSFIEFNVDIPERVFTLRNLEKPR